MVDKLCLFKVSTKYQFNEIVAKVLSRQYNSDTTGQSGKSNRIGEHQRDCI